MKKIFLFLLTAFCTMNVMSQNKIDRSKQPKAGPAPVIKINDPVIINLSNGMTVLVVEDHKLPRVSASLSIDRGPVYEGTKAGAVDMMGQMLKEGTTLTPKAQFDEIVDEMGANISLSSGGAFASALTRYFNNTFMLMSEAIQKPAFPQESFEKIKSQTLTGLKSNEKSAAAISGRVVRALAYGKNTAMGEFETEASIKALTLDDIKIAYKENITPSRSYLTFVGDITPDEAKALAEKAFGKWKGVKLSLPEIKNADNTAKTEIDFVDLPSAVQGEIVVSNLINNPLSNPDYHALMIANQILGGGAESKLFMNLREKHGFTYGSYSSTGNGRFQAQFTANAKVRSEKADSAVAEVMAEIKNMHEGKITEEELAIAKAKYNGSFALGMEDPERAATYATNILINKLPKDYYKNFLQKINAVTIADVQRVSKKYMSADNSRIVIVGNAGKIVPNLSRLGYTIKMFDKFAEPVVEKAKEVNIKETEKTSEAISAASVIESYLNAIGGKEEARKVNTYKASFTSELMGQQFSGTDIRMNPDKKSISIMMGTMVVMKQNFDGKTGYQSQGPQKRDMEESDIKEAQDDKAIISQLAYLTPDFKIDYLGKAQAGGEDAYKLKVTKPSGKVVVEYYSIKSGLLVREESSKSQGGQEFSITVDYKDYRKAGNVLFPYSIIQTAGEQEFPMNISDIKINQEVTEADFN